jgi:hypothetical protein
MKPKGWRGDTQGHRKAALKRKASKEPKWIDFIHAPSGKTLTSISVKGYVRGESYETRKLLSSEKGIPFEEITTRLR